jgi:Protein of unknown function (DUF3305)
VSAMALVHIRVGVVVERHKAESPWADFLWRPVSVLAGEPAAAPWTLLGSAGGVHTFYAGAATVELYRTETANYLRNLASGAPSLWVVLRQTGAEPPYEVFAVTADPAEGEAFTEAGNDLVDCVPMPGAIVEALEAFITQHHVERPFHKRERDRADPEALARRSPTGENEE